jgi:hypothetical protein
MAPQISDRDSAAACLRWVRELAARLDLDHPDAGVPAGTAHDHQEGPADAC